MLKFVDGKNEKKTISDAMRNINIYLNEDKVYSTSEEEQILKNNLVEYKQNLNELIKQFEEFNIIDINVNKTKGIKKIIKKIIAKFIGWYVAIYYKKQMNFNYYMLCALENEKSILEYLISMKDKEEH